MTTDRRGLRAALRPALAALSLASGAAKLAAAGWAVEGFARWGFPEGLRETVGAVEVALALALALPRSAAFGALGLSLVMAAAALTHLRTPGDAPLALVPLAVGGASIFVARPGLGGPAAGPVGAVAPAGARGLATFLALFTAITPALADWNHTHIFNPAWPAHAKFHGAQTMAFGAALGGLGLWLIWRRRDFSLALVVVGAYWATQALAIVAPGAAFVDPEFAARLPRVGGYSFSQLVMDVVLLTLLWACFQWAARPGPPPGAAAPVTS